MQPEVKVTQLLRITQLCEKPWGQSEEGRQNAFLFLSASRWQQSVLRCGEKRSLYTHTHTFLVPAIPVSHDVIAKSQHGNICHIHLVSCCAYLCVCVCVSVLLYPWCWNTWLLYMLAMAVESVRV